MNRPTIRYVLGRILLIEGLLLSLPLLVSIYFQEGSLYWSAFGISILVVSFLGLVMSWRKPHDSHISTGDGVIIVGLSWILLSAFGALPLMLSGTLPNFFDAFFEIVSGFTTTGSSVITNLGQLSKSVLFWRSFTHLIGGMGVLVFTLAILPRSDSDNVQLLKAEVPGPVFGKLVSKLSYMARILYVIYLAMTLILTVILVIGGQMPWFDASLLAFGTAGTGGFSISPYGFAIYGNPAFVEYAIGVGMLLFGMNFNLFYYLLLRQFKAVFSNEELRYYLGVVAVAVALICMNIFHLYSNHEEMFRHVFFSVSSVITTTGYATADFATWPLLSQVILIGLMFIGGCAGSTAGGLKVSRIVMYVKMAFAELLRIPNPNRVVTPRVDGKRLSSEMQSRVSHYLLIYSLFFCVLLFSVAAEANDFVSAFSSVAATFNNIGPGMGAVGPTASFAHYSDWNKFVLSVGMLAGRLELYPIILLFAPRTVGRLLHWRSTRALPKHIER